MNCSHCSATIPSDVLTCPYCGHETPNFAPAREREKQRKAQEAQSHVAQTAREKQQALGGLAGSAKVSLYWAMGGVLVCCLPVGSVVAIVLALRVRKLAASLDAATPWQAIVSIIGSLVWIATYLLIAVVAVVAEHEKSVRVTALKESTRVTATSAELTAETACELTELALLDGSANRKGEHLAIFRCDGAFEPGIGTAVLKDFEYARQSRDKPVKANACFSKGIRWKVDSIGVGPGCLGQSDAGDTE